MRSALLRLIGRCGSAAATPLAGSARGARIGGSESIRRLVELGLKSKGWVMPHKFKIGDVVYYRPRDRMHNTARGTYTITGLMPAMVGQQPEYRIRHFSEDFGSDVP
jgi:hypothetical protein